ncbi:taspase, threonine aspartase, 1 [Mortierella alpina]|uniref:Taspase, threonine aspartase, 1 n=1 Tax=Mortierella alpina TaxID=64518 RepID=A0A9P6IY96_MORAP|nr:taspase, threonine aspartase, 1 [Mortierella alpina]
MLVGSGAGKWVDTMGFTLDRVPSNPYVPTSGNPFEGSSSDIDMEAPINGSLVTRESLQFHLRFQEMLRNASTRELSSKREAEESSYQQAEHTATKKPALAIEDELLQDTVGAICVDRFGHVASGVSSGGIAMKFPGRVSEAAIFGAGCWAQDASETNAGFACSMTGAGEQISKTLLARSCMETMTSEDDTSAAAHAVLDNFMNNPLLRSYGERHAGFIALKVDALESGISDIDQTTRGGCGVHPTPAVVRGDFVIAHTTKTMGVAYMSTRDEKPKATMSLRKPGLSKTIFIASMRGQ